MAVSMRATGLTAGQTYTGVIAFRADPGAPDVRAKVGSTLGDTMVEKGTNDTARVVFTAAGTFADLELVPVGGDPETPVYLRGMGVYDGTYTGPYVVDDLRDPGTAVIVYDHEVRQGGPADYIVTDADGTHLEAVTVQVPEWGTWLKSPGRPYLNTRLHFAGVGEVTRVARRQRVSVDGATREVVLSQRRSGREGALRLATLTGPQSAAVARLLDDGLTVMLDTPPAWGIPYRYVSVGNTTEGRPMGEELALDRPTRVHVLEEVVEVDAPLGVTVVDRGRTYAALPTLFGSYVAIPATTTAYDTLAVGA